MTRVNAGLSLIVLLLTLATAQAVVPTGTSAQTPQQSYADWHRRLDFRPQEYDYRRSRIMDLLRSNGGGILLVPSSDGETHGATFRQLEDFWYYTGLEVPNSMLVLDADRDRSILFLPARDVRFDNPGRSNDFPGRPLGDDYRLRSIAGINQYEDIGRLEDFLTERVRSGSKIRVNMGADGLLPTLEIPLIGSLEPVEALLFRLRAMYPEASFENAFAPTARLRMVKSPTEIRHMRVAADATAMAIQAAAATIHTGANERSVQGAFESACRSFGAQSVPFTPIVKSGPNSLWPWRILAAHYDRRNRSMESDELVILDVGCEVDGYISDVGRTFPVGGTFTEIQREKLMISTRAADAIIAAVRPGVTLRELTAVAYEEIPDDEEQYMQTLSYFGHHIGMSAGDPALLDVPLEEGMVFTVEPWYYNHDLQISVFVEDVILVTEDGAEVLTAQLARSPEALEAMIR
jgi:Xaa-Pro aminopeptidase